MIIRLWIESGFDLKRKTIRIQEGQEKRKPGKKKEIEIRIQEGQEKKHNTDSRGPKNNPDSRKDRRKEKQSVFKKARKKNNSDSRRP